MRRRLLLLLPLQPLMLSPATPALLLLLHAAEAATMRWPSDEKAGGEPT